MKFYTEDGNWELVGNNTPIFFIRDPLKVSDFIRTRKRDPGRISSRIGAAGTRGGCPPLTEPAMGMEDDGKRHEIQQRMLKHWCKVHPEFGAAVEKGLGGTERRAAAE